MSLNLLPLGSCWPCTSYLCNQRWCPHYVGHMKWVTGLSPACNRLESCWIRGQTPSPPSGLAIPQNPVIQLQKKLSSPSAFSHCSMAFPSSSSQRPRAGFVSLIHAAVSNGSLQAAGEASQALRDVNCLDNWSQTFPPLIKPNNNR